MVKKSQKMSRRFRTFLIQNIKEIAVVIFALLLAVSFDGVSSRFNRNFNNFFKDISGEEKADSNIFLIAINSEDIESLAGWPLKRNYYALLINKLRDYNPSVIGMEVFLSDNLYFQSVYNKLLNDVITQTGNVVLSSVVTGVKKKSGFYFADSIIYPEPKRQKEITTGHLNYFLGKDGLVIPLTVFLGKDEEPALSKILASSKSNEADDDRQEIKINFHHSWEQYQSLSLLQFFRLEEQSDSLTDLIENKIILIGISDPTIAKTLVTPYDDELPGLGLHAIAADNILNNDFIRTPGFLIQFLFLIIIVAMILLVKASFKKNYIYIFAFTFFLLTGFLLLIYANVELNFALFYFPLIALLATDFSSHLINLRKKKDEADSLREKLIAKEKQLLKLQRKLNVSPEANPQELINQIDMLKSEIDYLKNVEQDSVTAEENYLPEEMKNFNGMVYRSKKMDEAAELIKKVAPQNATVLIFGESGSGKELAAQAIHQMSKRSGEKFVTVNCAALSETLLESELFGHVKGAFTNAINDKKGRFETADKGTIFLDEIGETSENFQAKLLRVLQNGTFERVGSSETIAVDVRIVAATNKNLENLVGENKFREDLYYRLNVFKIVIPPLRERLEDVEVLANHFAGIEDGVLTISQSAMDKMTAYRWKGNVRELESVIKRAAIFAKSEDRRIIKIKDLPDELIKESGEKIEDVILKVLREKEFSHSSINETAVELDLSRTIVSENFRGLTFRTYVESNFELDKTIDFIAATDNGEVLNKVESKVSTYLNNIKKDILKTKSKNFEILKTKFSSKYKNLPQKYHYYLDEIIKREI